MLAAQQADIPKSVRLAHFLQELAQLRAKKIHDLDSYRDGKALWLGLLPDEDECYSRHRSAPDEHDPDLWVEVRKPKLPKFPIPPEECRQWVDEAALVNAHEPPALRSSILPPASARTLYDTSDEHGLMGEPGSDGLEAEGAPTALRELRLEDHPDVLAAWDAYVTSLWQPWAAERRRWERIDQKYTKFFEIHSALQTKGEQLELLLGVGCLGWKVGTQRVHRHLVTARVALQFDEKRGRFQIRPEPSGAQLHVELDMLPDDVRPGGLETSVMQDLQSAGEDIWDRNAINAVLNAIAHRLSERGEYHEDRHTRLDAFANHPVIVFAPALILRPRSQRSLHEFLRKLRLQLENGSEVPPGWADLSEEVREQDSSGLGEDNDDPSGGTAQPIYLPLPVNDEQKQILRALQHPMGALVQGPPGTGKSHTIANLICHLLATGKRILITAQTPRALQVLRDKLPEEIRPLAVSLLGSGPNEQESLKESVQGINGKLNDPQAADYRAKAAWYSRERHRVEQRIADLCRRHQAIREQDTLEQHVAGYRGTAQAIATTLAEETTQFTWFTDRVPHDSGWEPQPPAVHAAIATLRRLPRQKREHLARLRPCVGRHVPSVENYRALVETERTAQTSLARYEGTSTAVRMFPAELLDGLRSAAAQLRRLEVAIENAAKRPQPWADHALRDILTQQDRPWFQLHAETDRGLAEIRDGVADEDRRALSIPSGVDWATLRHDAGVLRAHLASGGKPRWWFFRHSELKRCQYLAREVRVDGRRCDCVSALDAVIAHATMKLALAHVWKLWAGKAAPASESLAVQMREIEELQETLGEMLSTYHVLEEAKQAIAVLKDVAEPAWDDPRARVMALSMVESGIARIELAAAESQFHRMSEDLRMLLTDTQADRPLVEGFLAAVNARDVVAYAASIDCLEQLEQDADELRGAKATLDALRSHLPHMVQEMEEAPERPEWDERITALPGAVNHAKARQWLDEFITGADIHQIERLLDQAREERQKRIANEAACLAWTHLLARMHERHRRALTAWQQAIKALGKGTGKYAFRHRREAQAQLQRSRDAIPAWIMPLHRVFESVDPEPGVFDVVIVDEASQCGPDALPLFFIGAKVLIVGDDQQISPAHVGVNHEHVHQRVREFLGDFEHRGSFGLEQSLFDHGELRIGNRIVLREHFRCMPEIIRFSNDLCYKTSPLIPLRQYPPRRLEPLVARHVGTGYREGESSHTLNKPEADALVEAVVACCADSAYMRDGRKVSMGVISLLGWAQAEYIEHLLVQRIGIEAMEQRRLLCGDAYSFQGDERDVIFLSMVAAPNTRLGALTRFSDQQRFNVAASRARDQLWLFHSVMPADLSEQCVRRQLLEHFLDPSRTAREVAGVNVHELQKLALRADRRIERPPAPYDSWFEVDVALRLASDGYRVVPQHDFAGYRIDLVVEGAQARLAVECDGDRWHGAERYQADLDRQRQLERAGWTFARIRGSAFYVNPEHEITRVRQRLDDLGISPGNY